MSNECQAAVLHQTETAALTAGPGRSCPAAGAVRGAVGQAGRNALIFHNGVYRNQNV